jgi:hypothetical protein
VPRRRQNRRPISRTTLHLERLEHRQLLAVVNEFFKFLEFDGVGTFSGNTRADIIVPNDFHDDYSGGLNFHGGVSFSDQAHAETEDDPELNTTSGTLNGTSNCPPSFALNDPYASHFVATNAVTLNGTAITMGLTTSVYEYTNPPCGEGYHAGATPFDTTFTGTVNLSSIPYKVVLNTNEMGTIQTTVGPRPYRNNGVINIDVTPVAKDENGVNIPYNVHPFQLSQQNGVAEFFIAVDGPTRATPSATTVLSDVKLYLATGPNKIDVVGAPLDSYPLYWNSGYAQIQTQLPATIAANITHLVVVADGGDKLVEGNETDNVIALPLSAGFVGLNDSFTLDEETTESIDFSAWYQGVQGVDIDESQITITVAPLHGRLSVNSTTGVVTYSPDANYSGPDRFRYFVVDADGNQSTEGEITIGVTEVPEPYRNPAGAYYVSPGDLSVTALDAVLVITELNATGPRTLVTPAPGQTIFAYVDINGDNQLTSLDAVLIIIRLNAGGSGEGEADELTLVPETGETGFGAAPSTVTSEDAVVTNSPVLVPIPAERTATSLLSAAGSVVVGSLAMQPVAPAPLPWVWTTPAEDGAWLGVRSARSVDWLFRAKEDWWRAWSA